MPLPTREDAAAIAAMCREFVAAYDQRNPAHPFMTLHEQVMLAALGQSIAVLRHEAVHPLSETAA